MNTSIIVCAGKNTSSRSETAAGAKLKSGNAATVIEAASAEALQAQLEPYRNDNLRVMFYYFFVPDKSILADPGEWWNKVSGQIESVCPDLSQRASAQPYINQDTGGGFLQFCWDDISVTELVTYGKALDNVLPGSKGCFIATACYGDYDAAEVLILRQFRDEILQNSACGSSIVDMYYRLSPPFARWLGRHHLITGAIRVLILNPTIYLIDRMMK